MTDGNLEGILPDGFWRQLLAVYESGRVCDMIEERKERVWFL
jgi:hypothetical protein